MTNKPENLIAFQGVNGAHADMACRAAFPYMQTLAVPTFEDAIKAVEEGKAHLCMIPIENSKAGRVAEIHNLLPQTKLYIAGEYFQRIEHCLASCPSATFESIERVYSHPQALMQCQDYLAKKNYQREAYANTAMAAKDVAAWADPTKAAICSRLAAELYGLHVIEENIEDASDNTTVFVAMSREPQDVDPGDKDVITSVIFTARNIPSALYKALGGFATNHVNLIKLESYIPAGSSQTAQFFISFEGHPAEDSVQRALEELGFFSRRVKILGVYCQDSARLGE